MDCDGGDVFPMKGEHRMAHRADGRATSIAACVGLLLMGGIALHSVMLQVVCRGDLGKESGHHLDYVINGHSAYIVFDLSKW